MRSGDEGTSGPVILGMRLWLLFFPVMFQLTHMSRDLGESNGEVDEVKRQEGELDALDGKFVEKGSWGELSK